jgi:hypothetical protein
MSTTGRPHGGATTALLWDLDNVSVPAADLGSLAQVLSGLVEPSVPRVASANWRAFRLAGDTLRAHGIRVICGGRDPAGADGVLLRQVRRLRKRGVERFVVASDDHAFARIAASSEVHVVTLTGDYVSGRLRAAARSVTVLTRTEQGWERIPAALPISSAGQPSEGSPEAVGLGSPIKAYLPVSRMS